MILAEFQEVSLRYRGPLLLDEISCQIRDGQRIGLLGRNGSGKTSLMRMLVREIEPDSGEVLVDSRTRVALLPQEVPRDICGPSRDVVAAGCPASEDPEAAWRVEQQVKETLSRMELDGDALFETLSSGMKRRVLLAKALAARPDLLLLDEPTNHLDIGAIDWLERFLERWDGTLMFVTHDRMLLRKLAGRILEIDGGRLFDWSCDYDTFLKRKDQALAGEAKQQALFDKRLAQEEVWIRQGIKARRTRNEGRVRALEQMRRQHQERRGASARFVCNCSSSSQRHSGRRCRQRLFLVRRAARRRRLFHDDCSWRQDRDHRPEWGRQDDAAPTAVGGADAHARQHSLGH